MIIKGNKMYAECENTNSIKYVPIINKNLKILIHYDN